MLDVIFIFIIILISQREENFLCIAAAAEYYDTFLK